MTRFLDNATHPKVDHQRRHLIADTVRLAALTSVGLATLLPANAAATSSGSSSRILFSAGKDPQGNYGLFRADNSGIKLVTPLPSRAHEVLIHPNKKQLLVLARRPEKWCLVFDIASNQLVQTIKTGNDSHLYGHAVFDHSGRFLITTENHIETGEGQIVLRDSHKQYAISKTFPSYGIGPHQLKLMPSGNTVVVANGGIHTHPQHGREKLNLATMRPNLSYINLSSGTLSEQVTLPNSLHQLSIRHLDINPKGDVAIAMQYQGDTTDHVPLVASHRQGQPLRILEIPLNEIRKMRGYCGSVCFDTSGQYLAVSAPRGDSVVFFDFAEKRYLGTRRIPVGCGLASSAVGTFDISSGHGKLYQHTLGHYDNSASSVNSDISFDNHLSALS